MRAIMVVPLSNVGQPVVELVAACQRLLLQFSLDRSNKPLNSPILPGIAWINPLLTNAEQPQTESEHPRNQHRLIVRAKELGLTIALYGLNQFM
jgi:hypothetical protein